MKQSTKLLSLVLALVMAFSCMAVVGNAALVKSAVEWDSIDDAILTPEQVADIALDMVDDMLADGGDDMYIDITVAKIDLRSIDTAIRDIEDLGNGILVGIAGAFVDLGVIEELDFDPLTINSSGGDPVQRSHGDIVVITHLLEFISDNASKISPAVKGIGTSGGLSLGLIEGFLGDSLSDINKILGNLPGFIKNMVYDMLIYGSYNDSYEDDCFPASEDLTSLPSDVNTISKMVDYAIGSLLANPQDYDWTDADGDGKDDTKVWDMGSKLLPSVAAFGRAAASDYFSVAGTDFDANNGLDATQNTVFQLIDKLAPFAIYDIGVPALNHNLKKALMEAVGAEFNEISAGTLPQTVADDFEVSAVDGKESYVTYVAYDRMKEYNDSFYYTTMKTVPDTDDNGAVKTDPETGEELTKKERKYYKVNMAVANEFADLINWKWEFTAPVPGTGDNVAETIAELNYDALIKEHGSIVESLNDIIYKVYKVALTPEAQAEFEETTQNTWVAGATSAKINDNVTRLVKYLLGNFAGRIFGSDSAYVDYDYSFYENMSLIDIVALIGPSFFEDVMPQLVIPKDGDGAYAFTPSGEGEPSVAFLQFGAIVFREFVTEIAPNVNYDAYIFAEDSLENGDGRQFAEHEPEEWFNIILNMGMDIAYTYLYQITNFKDDITFSTDGLTRTFTARGLNGDTPEAPESLDEIIVDTRWKKMLNDAIDWAVGYVGQGSKSIITGLDPNSVNKWTDPLDKLSYILNTLLPLGFINGLNDSNFDASVSVLFTKMKTFLTEFDFTEFTSLFGRNDVAGTTLKRGNILAKPIIPMALGLVNDILKLVFNRNILATNQTNGHTIAPTTAEQLIDHTALQMTVENILWGLYGVSDPLLQSALPVVGKLIKGWGTEQNFVKPKVTYSTTVELTGGALVNGDGAAITEPITVKNAADGVWRSWVDADGNRYTDEQYQIKLTGVVAKEFDGSANAAGVTVSGVDTTNFVAYGKDTTFNFGVSGVTEDKFVRFDISYQVYEGETLMTNDVYTNSIYVYLTNTKTDEGTEANFLDQHGTVVGVRTPQYIDYTGDVWGQMQSSNIVYIKSKNSERVYNLVVTGTAADGITPGKAVLTDEYLGADTQRDWNPLQIFTNGDYVSSNDDKNINVSGASFNATTFDAANKVSGVSKSTLKFTFTAEQKKLNAHLKYETSATYNASGSATLVYYDGATRNELSSLVNKELAMGKVKADYETEGSSYADELLTYTPYTDEDGEEVVKNTNFNTFAWIDEDEKEIATGTGDEVCAGITVDPDDDTVGTYTANGETINVKKVTKIANANLWNTYVTALNTTADAALAALRTGGNFDYESALTALRAASTDLGYAKKKVASSVDGVVADLETTLDSIEATYTDNYDYTDYKMHRLNRLNDARDDARHIIDLKKDSAKTVAMTNATLPYNGMNKFDVNAIVDLVNDEGEKVNTSLQYSKDGTNIVKALLKNMTTEELKAHTEWLENRALEYAEVTTFDVALAKSILEKTSQRLLNRTYKADGTDLTYLITEINSAEAEIDTDNIYDGTEEPIYTARSWAKYQAALQAAKDVRDGTNNAVTSQKNAFDAKWELLCCRNELVLVEYEADYSELETLIAQAEWALNNMDLYNNTAKELGQVLAELGAENVVNADGYGVELFPGNARYVESEPYSYEDQDVIDRAARELKEALARLKFKALSVTANVGSSVAIQENAIIVFDDIATKDVDETVTARLATIAAGLKEDAVKALFNVQADNVTDGVVAPDDITISNDLHYSVEKYEEDDDGNLVLVPYDGFVGTNSVVTFYTIKSGIKVPVATVKVIVNGDINGDGCVDAIDAAQINLVSSKKAALDGCYYIAGNLAGETDTKRAIDANDYAKIINLLGVTA